MLSILLMVAIERISHAAQARDNNLTSLQPYTSTTPTSTAAIADQSTWKPKKTEGHFNGV